MSGRPNKPDIKELHFAMKEVLKADEIVARSTTEAYAADKRRIEAEMVRDAHLKKIDELMARMDISSPGNSGYKNRLLSFLGGLIEVSENSVDIHK
jgi:hypothetical protein